MPQRDERGRFTRESAKEFGRRGGLARAERLTAEEMAEIARMGLEALAEKHFDGDLEAAKRWFSAVGKKARRKRQQPEAQKEV